MVNRITIKDVSCGQREYGVNVLISLRRIEKFDRPLNTGDFEELKAVGPVGSALAARILSVEGNLRLFIEPYSITITKAEAFDWDDIDAKNINALRECFPKDERELVKVEYRQDPKKDEREPLKMPVKVK